MWRGRRSTLLPCPRPAFARRCSSYELLQHRRPYHHVYPAEMRVCHRAPFRARDVRSASGFCRWHSFLRVSLRWPQAPAPWPGLWLARSAAAVVKQRFHFRYMHCDFIVACAPYYVGKRHLMLLIQDFSFK